MSRSIKQGKNRPGFGSLEEMQIVCNFFCYFCCCQDSYEPVMKLTIKKFITLTLLLCIAGLAKTQDFEVSPVLMRFNTDPGEIQMKTINIVNHSNKREKFHFSLSDYTLDAEGNKQSAPAGTTPRSCANWMTINPSFVELNPNESASVEVLMTVPPTGFQTKWGIINIQPAKEQEAMSADKEMATGVVVVPRIVVLVQQSPRSNTNYRGSIGNIREVTRAGDGYRTFQATIKNMGDKVLEAKVTLAVANIMTASERSYDPVKVAVYPDNSRIVELYLREQLQKGQYAVAAMLDYGHRQPIEITQMLLEVK